MKKTFLLCIFFIMLASSLIAQVIARGGGHSLALCNYGYVQSWGTNQYGQLGNGSNINTSTPVFVNNIDNIIAVSCGYNHSLALRNDSTVWSWGYNSSGQLGDGTNINRTAPVFISGLTNVIAIAGGGNHTLVLKNDGTVWAWGNNTNGQLGDGTTTNRKNPVQVTGLTGIVSIACGYAHSLALRNDGTVWAWGSNLYGQLGNGNTINSSVPVHITTLTNIVSIDGGNEHSLALKNNGTVWSWGLNANGQLGDGTNAVKSTPVQVLNLSNVKAISGGDDYSLALKNNGTVFAWGINVSGQLGDGTSIDRNTPVLTNNISNATSITAGNRGLVLKQNGAVLTMATTNTQVTGLCSVTESLIVNISKANVNCYGNNNGTASVNPIIGVSPFTYLWSNGATTDSVSNLAPGTYSVTITDSNTDTTTVYITISQPAVLSTLSLKTNIFCNGGANGSIDLTVMGGSGNFFYTWSNGATEQDIDSLFAGIYTVTIVDAICNDTITDTMNISQPDSLITSFITSPVTCGSDNGNASATVTGGTLPYSYVWNTGITSATINNLTAGNYTLKVTDANGCKDTTDISIVLQSPAVISTISSQTNVLCNLYTDGSATVNVSAGTPAYTYSWSTLPVQTAATATGLSAGTYTVTITDTNGCTSSDTVTITVMHPISVIANATSTIIFPGTSVTLSGSGTVAYTWSEGVVNGVPFIPVSTNTYTVTGTDGSSCSNTDTVTVTVKNSSDKTLSAGGLFSLAVCANGVPKSWGDNTYGQLGNGTTIQQNSPVQLNNLTGITAIAGGYYHTLCLKNDGTVWGCGANANGRLGDGTTVNKSSPVQALLLTNIIAIASGKAHSLALKNDGTVWSFGLNSNGQLGDGTLVNRSSAVQVTGLSHIVAIAAGYNHSLALKDDGTVWAWGDNGWGQLGANSPGVIKIPQMVNGISDIIAIAGGENHSLALRSDGTVWAWGINNNGELGNGTNNYSYTPVSVNGLYHIVEIAAGMSHSLALKADGTVWAWGLNGWGQLGNGNTANSNIPVQVSNLTGISAIAAGGAHSLAQKNNGSVWSWGLNMTGQIGDGSYVSNRLTPVQATGLCQVTSALSTTISQTNNTCLAGNVGTATVSVSGGITPYTYLWNNGMTTATITNLTQGTYTVTVTDALNNSIINTVAIHGGVQVSSIAITPLCNGDSNGIINIFTSDGGGNYSYQWSNGSTTQNLNGITSGIYTVTVFDGICVDTLIRTISVNDPLTLTSVTTSIPATCGNNNGSASVVASGGTTPYSYLWSTGDTSAVTPDSLPQGSYTVIITDAHGCSHTDSAHIIQQYPPITSTAVSQTNVICNGNSTGSVTITPTGGTPGYSFLWSTIPEQTTQTANNLAAGNYTVTVTDVNGCIYHDSVSITQPPPVPVIANSTATVIFPGNSITLNGEGASSYVWSGGISDGSTFIPTSTSTYTVTGTDTLGCSNTATVTVTIKTKHRLIAGGNGSNLVICSDSTVMKWDNTNNLASLVSDISEIIDVEMGQFHSMALKSNGTVWSWGQNGNGSLGNGTTITNYTPSQVLNLTDIVDIAGGNDHSLALKSDGTVWAWGGNGNGQLGDSTLLQRLTPVKVHGLTNVIQISAAIEHSIALKDDGTVWAWGINSNGELGDATGVQKLVPVQVATLTNVNSISTCGHHSLALKNDGTVWSWGASHYGQLGNGSSTLSYSPVQVSTITGITEIATGSQHSIALKNDGTIFGWGSNSSGQIAGSTSYHSTPIQLNNYSIVAAVACGYYNTLVLKNDGTLWTTNGGGIQIGGVCPIFIDSNEVAGIHETNNNAFMISVYPNPFTEYTSIEFNSEQKNTLVRIKDMLGQEIKTITYSGKQLIIEKDNIEKGIYLIEIINENKNRIITRIIVQ